MNKKHADDLKKEEFKGSSRIGNKGISNQIPRNLRQFKKTFK
jgi:hypothetical protein